MYARSIKFTTLEQNENILQLSKIQSMLQEMVSAENIEEYNNIINNGIDMNVDVFTKDTRISINGGPFNDLIENQLYSTNNITKISSVISENPSEGVIVFTMADR